MKRISRCSSLFPLAVAAAFGVVSISAQAERGCPSGFKPDGTELITNGDFSAGYTGFTTAIPYQAPLGSYPFDDNSSSYPNTGIGIVTGPITDGGFIEQAPFPGDGMVAAASSWLAYNGNDAGAPTRIWEQQVTGISASAKYAFTAYYSNALRPGDQATDLVAPRIAFYANNVQVGDAFPVCDAGGGLDPVDASCVNEAVADKWRQLGVTITPSASSLTLAIHDAQIKSAGGNDFAMTAVSLQRCVPTGLDSDGDGVVDSIDIDDDNDGILDTVEGEGDFDGDGIVNRLDLDADNDGLPDIIEALGSDADNDGRVDGFTDSNGNGYHDALETTPWVVPDTDNDGAQDFLDLDSDADIQTDLVESGADDGNADGVVDNFSDADGDGWDDAARSAFAADSLVDSDSNGVPDYRQAVAGDGADSGAGSPAQGKVLTQLEGGLGGFGYPGLALSALAAFRFRKRSVGRVKKRP